MTPNDYNLPVWAQPDSYFGHSPDGNYLILSHHRDSCLLDESNWDAVSSELFDADSSNHVYTFTANHWGVGWIEHLILKSSAPEYLQQQAAEILGALESYPVYDEQDLGRRQIEWAEQEWERLDTEHRIALCRQARISIFAARRDELPSDPQGYIIQDLCHDA